MIKKRKIPGSLSVLLALTVIATVIFSSFPSHAANASDNNITVTVKVENADIRDVISAIALNMGCSVIFTGEASRVNLDVRDFTPEDALSALLKTVGLDYFRNGDTIIVGTKDKLTADFSNNMALTKFTLKYVTSEMVGPQIDSLNLGVQKFTIDTNPYAIWVQGFPQELAQVSELVSMLDRPENSPAQSSVASPSKLASIALSYITAEQMNSVLMEAGLKAGLILDSNPKTLYVYANASDLNLINDIQKKMDVAENQQGSSFVITAKKLQFVKTGEILPIISQFGLNVDVITLDRIAMTVWLKGDEATVRQVSSLIDQIDTEKNIDETRFFIRKLTNITAKEAETRLKLLNIPEIQTYTFSYPGLTKSILVVCPQDYQLFVKNHLNQLDVATDKIRIPVDYSDDATGSSLLAARRDLLVSLTGIPATSFTISNNVTRDSKTPHYVLILEESQEKISWVQELIKQIDSPIN